MADETTTTTETTAAPAAPAAAPVDAPATPDKISPADDRAALVRMAAEAEKSKGAEASAATETTEVAGAAEGAAAGKETAAETETREALSDAMAEAGPEELARLQEMARKLGFVVDDRKIWSKERADFREHQRKQRAALEQAKQQAIAEVEQLKVKHQADVEKAQAISTALEAGNWDEFAKLAGYKDWAGLQGAVIERIADPNYKRLQELERAVQEQRERDEKAREEFTRRQQLQETAERERRYLTQLSQRMASSQDPLVQVLAEDEAALQVIAKVQRERWDPEAKTTVSPERAVQLSGIDKQIRSMYDRWQKVFGGNGSASAQASVAVPAAEKPATAKPKTNKTQVVKGPSVEAAPAADWKDDKDFIKYAMERMKNAAEQERGAAKS